MKKEKWEDDYPDPEKYKKEKEKNTIIEEYDEQPIKKKVTGCGYAIIAALFMLVGMGVVLIVLALFGFFRSPSVVEFTPTETISLTERPETIKVIVVEVTDSPAGIRETNSEGVAPTPEFFRYAEEMPLTGGGLVLIPASDSILFHFRPINVQVATFDFVKKLTFHVHTQESGNGESTLMFSEYNHSGGWRMNSGKNKIAWGENIIPIKYPDPVVSRSGEIFMDIRNYGQDDIEIQQMGFALTVEDENGEETTIQFAPSNE